ncbi:MAG: SNARE associated Golgi protein [Chloroflexi bacterium OLB14]|nr:MAG: SNARE associated Golgi protein [Chloroflexi bacterium OLB14]
MKRGKKKEESGKRKVKSGKKRVSEVEKSKSSDLRPETLDSKPKSNFTTNLLRIVAVLAVIGITVYIYSIRDRVEEFTQYGYFGIFLIMLLANATVILPAPGVAVVFAMGSVFNPLGVALSAGIGGALGEITGYLAGFSGQAVVENTQVYNRIMPWIKKYGAWVILILSAIPNPFFDIAGIAAGIAKIPTWQFLLACWVGQTIKMAMFAYAGYYSIDWIANFYD